MKKLLSIIVFIMIGLSAKNAVANNAQAYNELLQSVGEHIYILADNYVNSSPEEREKAVRFWTVSLAENGSTAIAILHLMEVHSKTFEPKGMAVMLNDVNKALMSMQFSSPMNKILAIANINTCIEAINSQQLATAH